MRNCFAPLIPEFELAAVHLSAAADAALAGDHDHARHALQSADLEALCEFAAPIIGPTNPAIHGQESMPTDTIPKAQRTEQRMPGKAAERAIFQRDGWRCRFCGCKVVSREARAILVRLYPEEARWGAAGVGNQHCGLSVLAASLDHILPHSRGGTNAPENLVTACGCCQFGRNQWTLEEVGFTDPRERPPIVDNWDGLTRLLILKNRLSA